MAGVTDSPYRRITRRFGAGLLYTECISAEGVRRRGRASLELCRFTPEERPIAVQLFGSAPEPIAEAAAVIADLFAPDLIDINCGCPVRKFVTKGCGGALMLDPDRISRIVETTRKASGLPVSVKLRSGYFPGEELAPRAAQAAADAGAALVAIHGRYVRKAKGSRAEWDVIARVKETVLHLPVVGNGDIFSYDDARRMSAETGCDRVMIARWAEGRPWLFEPMRDGGFPIGPVLEPDFSDKIALLIEQYRMEAEVCGERTAILRMRKQAGWYLHGMPGAAKLRQEVMTTTALAALVALLNNYQDEQMVNATVANAAALHIS